MEFRLQLKAGLSPDSVHRMHGGTVSSPLGDDVLDTGKIGGGDDLSVSDKIMPAYSKNHTVATHMEGLGFA